jgi:hypothetical protein
MQFLKRYLVPKIKDGTTMGRQKPSSAGLLSMIGRRRTKPAPRESFRDLLDSFAAAAHLDRAAPRKPKKHGLVSSEQLYLLGMELMDQAGSETIDRGEASKEVAFKYRDGVLIAVLSLIVLRRRTVAALRIGKQLVKSGGGWALDIPSEDVKSKRPLDFALAPNLCDRIDL